MIVVVAVLLIAANGFFVAGQFVLVSARRSRIEELAASGNRRAKQALTGMRDISMILAAGQLGIALASLGLGAVTEPAVEHWLEGHLSFVGIPASAGRPLAFVVTLLLVAAAHMTLGEMVPKNLALAGPERAALWLGPPLVVFARVTRPALWLLNAVTRAFLRVFGIRPTTEISHTYTAEDLAAMTRRSRDEGVLDEVESNLTQAALALEGRTVEEVMTPWREVVSVPYDITADGLERLVAETGYTRFPVAGAEIGWYVHVKAALRVSPHGRKQPLPRGLRHPLTRVAPDMPLPRLLAQMRRRRSHLALVGDPASPSGIASFDDVLASLGPPERSATPPT